MQTGKAGWALGRVHRLYASAPIPLMSKATPCLLGPSTPWFDPQAQKGNTESQWAQCDPKHKAWPGRSCLSFQRDPGIIQGGNCLLSKFFSDNDACEKYHHHHHHGNCRPLLRQSSDLPLCLCPSPLPLQPALPCTPGTNSQHLVLPMAILIRMEQA